MPTTITQDQAKKLRDAGIPHEYDDSCSRLVAALDKHEVTLDWDKFVAFVSIDTGRRLEISHLLVGAFNPKP